MPRCPSILPHCSSLYFYSHKHHPQSHLPIKLLTLQWHWKAHVTDSDSSSGWSLLCLTGHFWNHHVGAFLPAQPGHPGAALQEQRGSEENHDHHGASSSLLQHRCHPPNQPEVQNTLVLFVCGQTEIRERSIWATVNFEMCVATVASCRLFIIQILLCSLMSKLNVCQIQHRPWH